MLLTVFKGCFLLSIYKPLHYSRNRKKEYINTRHMRVECIRRGFSGMGFIISRAVD